ncbi:MAG: hypothetical protein JSW66_08415 [Phycisphaerales bacterium]|nr:MAG: hypothetical protein JSW66_08415 [Phycisphaerales bacterium]
MPHRTFHALIVVILFIPFAGCNRIWSSGSTRNALSSSQAGNLIVDANFPGGNIIVVGIKDNTVFIRPDQRDSSDFWFYWYFRVRGGPGRTVKFEFTGRNPIGTRGPAFSTDGGHTWSWLGATEAGDSSFTYTFGHESEHVRFCFSIPYLEANLHEFLDKYVDSAHLTVHELCRTRKGRTVERIHAGKINTDPKYSVLLTTRHHACETIASYTLEGLLDAVLADTDLGRWYQNNVEVLAIPFVDKDGVEEGDQGKNRRPHDHNRDYQGQSVYPSIEAIRRFVPEWSKGKLDAAVDLHCPHISGKYNEVIYIVGSVDAEIWRQQQEFSTILESVRQGPLPYSAESSLPFGTAWNTVRNYGGHKSCSRWAAEQSGIRLATTIEIPYANVGTATVTAEAARTLGRDVALALRQYLETGKH